VEDRTRYNWSMTTTPQEPAPDDHEEPILDDREEAERLQGSPPPPDPEQDAVLESVTRLSQAGPTTAGAVADAICFPLPEVRRILEQLSPQRVRLGGAGADGTPQVSPV
jgi:hypothetical protein